MSRIYIVKNLYLVLVCQFPQTISYTQFTHIDTKDFGDRMLYIIMLVLLLYVNPNELQSTRDQPNLDQRPAKLGTPNSLPPNRRQPSGHGGRPSHRPTAATAPHAAALITTVASAGIGAQEARAFLYVGRSQPSLAPTMARAPTPPPSPPLPTPKAWRGEKSYAAVAAAPTWQ